MNRKVLLTVKNFTVHFKQYLKGLKQKDIQVIYDFTFELFEGEILAIVGASGSGKSLLAHSVLGILPSNSYSTGTIKYKNMVLTQEKKEALRGNEIALIPQSVAYLDPLMKAKIQIENPLKKSKMNINKFLSRFQLTSDSLDKYPFQLSGGMARRVLIGTALTSEAKLIIADEPTPGLHQAVVTETLATLRELAKTGCGIIMITHDIDLAFLIADRIAIFNNGVSVEIVDAKAFQQSADNVNHPYSKALWHALPQNGFHSIRGKDYSEYIELPGKESGIWN